MPKKPNPVPPPPPECRDTIGLAPAVLANRDYTKIDRSNAWCLNSNLHETDRYSDPLHPKTITYAHVVRADEIIKEVFTATPLMALAYQGQKLHIKITVVMPTSTDEEIVDLCKSFGAIVHVYGDTLVDCRRRAFQILRDQGGKAIYINGYDYPHVIAGAGTIALEILDQLPDVHTILVPIGGGGLIAGVAAVTKHLKPEVKIYGVEPIQSCSFFKAMDNERPYAIEAVKGVAASLTVPVAGENAFHTAHSLIDKMVLVEDDWICRAILHLAEEENLIAEGAGAIGLGAIMSLPALLPELQGKKVVCIISGANVKALQLNQMLSRGKAVDGRLITFTVTLDPDLCLDQLKVFRIIGSVGCNIVQYHTEREWLIEDKLLPTYLTIQVETKDLKQACTLRRVMDRLFPNRTEFPDDVFKPIQTCVCFPKKKM